MPDPRNVTATVVVAFGADAAADNDALVAEVDGREDGLNAGKTSFTPGEDVWILVYPSDNVVLNAPVSSAGNVILRAGTELVEKEQDVNYIDEIETQVGYPIQLGFTSQWIGIDGGIPAQIGQLTLQIPQPVAEHHARILRVNWTAQARAYRLTNTLITGFDEYTIIVHFTGIAS